MNHLDQRPRQRSIFPLVKEAGCAASVAHPPSPTNPGHQIAFTLRESCNLPVNVLVQLLGHVVAEKQKK